MFMIGDVLVRTDFNRIMVKTSENENRGRELFMLFWEDSKPSTMFLPEAYFKLTTIDILDEHPEWLSHLQAFDKESRKYIIEVIKNHMNELEENNKRKSKSL